MFSSVASNGSLVGRGGGCCRARQSHNADLDTDTHANFYANMDADTDAELDADLDADTYADSDVNASAASSHYEKVW